ncbi:hypothetical protein FB451DRAFT_1173527 [Mycena latifolia]|nr:hypothetical protein FB451DRAFT_1173527 [Mycena latifolia]
MQWLTQPVLWHSSRVRSDYDFTKMNEDQKNLIETRFHNASTLSFDALDSALTWYTSDWDYALTTMYFFCASIGVLALLRWGSWALHRRSATPSSKAGTFDRLVALASYTTARGWRLQAFDYYSPPLAAILSVLAIDDTRAQTFVLGQRGDGLFATVAPRTDWLSLGIMPFMIAFATKSNYVAFLTRTSHERLQVEWSTDRYVWTGVAALVPQPCGDLHGRALHTCQLPALVVANLALCGAVWLFRVVRATLTPGTATVTVLEDRTLRVRIAVPKRFRWAAGQHVFVRFLFGTLHWASSHPFTIANLPDAIKPFFNKKYEQYKVNIEHECAL